MAQICTNCGNRQHDEGATQCLVCGQRLAATYDSLTTLAGTGGHDNPRFNASASLDSRSYVVLTNRGQSVNIDVYEDITIGSSPDCELRLNDPNVRPNHARLYVEDGSVFIQAWLQCLVFVNGRVLGNLPVMVGTADQVKIGETMIKIVPNDRVQTSVSNYSPRQAERSVVVNPEPNSIHISASDISGTIRHIDGPHMENPEPTVGTRMGDIAKIGLALWKPVLALVIKPTPQVPVRYIRVESDDGEVHAVIMRGHIHSGMINLGDRVDFWGTWRGRTLNMTRAYNHTLGTAVVIRRT